MLTAQFAIVTVFCYLTCLLLPDRVENTILTNVVPRVRLVIIMILSFFPKGSFYLGMSRAE